MELMSEKAPHSYQFGDWRIEPELNCGMRGGERKQLQPRAMDVLLCLLEHPGELVCTRELLDRGWPDRVVEENAVQQRISMIRRFLEDDAKNPRYIQSISKRGYRAIAPISRIDKGAKADRWASTMLSTTPIPRIAVLPMTNMSDESSQEYFSDGLTEDIITDLAHIPGLQVVARQSSFAYKTKTADARQVGRELNVDFVLEGSVRRSADQVRVVVQLIDTSTGHHVWANRYDRSLDDVFSLQDELTGEIVTALDVELVSGERGRHQRRRFNKPESGEAFYRGLAHLNRFDQTDNVRARKFFEKLTSLEPESILGYVQQAMCLQQEIMMGWSNDASASIDDMGVLVERSLNIDGSDPVALGYAGMHQLLLGNHGEAIRYAEQAIVEAPDMDGPYYTLGWYQMFSEMPLDAIENLKRSIRLIPVVTAPRASVLGACYRNSGQLDMAVATLEDAVNNAPTFLFARVVLASCYSRRGNKRDAKREVGEILFRDPTYTITRYMNPNLYRNQASKEQWADALRAAGLPD